MVPLDFTTARPNCKQNLQRRTIPLSRSCPCDVAATLYTVLRRCKSASLQESPGWAVVLQQPVPQISFCTVRPNASGSEEC